jgi:hypothetical protein
VFCEVSAGLGGFGVAGSGDLGEGCGSFADGGKRGGSDVGAEEEVVWEAGFFLHAIGHETGAHVMCGCGCEGSMALDGVESLFRMSIVVLRKAEGIEIEERMRR